MSLELEADPSRDEVFISRFPIHRACRDGDLGALVSLGQRDSNRADLAVEDSCRGWTPIHWAAQHGQLDCVAYLVQLGCEVNLVTSRFHQTPTHSAAFGGHPHCVVWLTQAGADINRQDVGGEAPIHKAAQSGSLECVRILLGAGAEPHLRNALGQTAADLAHAHGFHECSRLIATTQRDDDGDASHGRKRLLGAVTSGHRKKARRADDATAPFQRSGGEELESMNMEPPEELGSDDTTPNMNGHHHHHHHHHTAPDAESKSPAPPSSRPANQQTAATAEDACGPPRPSGSPGSCVSSWPAWRGPMGLDSEDFLRYGHHHGFGDTAEELTDRGATD
ncbi:ankyrin repeat domain-containing protein 10-like [Brachionichthys hirsutus]|uniref:ankyrin repeat domain-containing protein 10-like n=1 Tax=Brachionichthys hirsutus TaxID=412623 RepID=UPI0036047758